MRCVPASLHNDHRQDKTVCYPLPTFPAAGVRGVRLEEGTQSSTHCTLVQKSDSTSQAPTQLCAHDEVLTSRTWQKCEQLPDSAIKGFFQAFAGTKS